MLPLDHSPAAQTRSARLVSPKFRPLRAPNRELPTDAVYPLLRKSRICAI